MAGYYHLSVKMIGRAEGRSAVACAAYRSGQTLFDERYNKTHDYAPRRGVTESYIVAPEGAPSWMFDRQSLWNEVEKAEKRKDAQLARELELALPHQVDQDTRRLMVETFIAEELTSRGMVVDYAIHSPNGKGDQRNWHAHLLTSLRPVADDGFSRLKDREACSKETVQHWRAAWAEIQNRTFERLGIRDEEGHILKVDHRSYENQGLDLEPTLHLGVLATAMEREGTPTEIGDMNRAIKTANDNRQLTRRRAANLSAEILNREILERLEQTREAVQEEHTRDDWTL